MISTTYFRPFILTSRGLPLLLLGICLSPIAWSADYSWPQWGGRDRNFVVNSGKLAENWPEKGPQELWRRPLGGGYSAIVSDGSRLFTMYRDGEEDVVIAMEAKSGKTLWEHRYMAKTYAKNQVQFGKGPNATPLILGDRLVTAGYTGVVSCLQLETGKLIWSLDLIQDHQGVVLDFGYSVSPLVYKGNIVTLAGGEAHGVLALSPEDGRVVWRSPPLDISYAAPILIEVDGQDQIVFFSADEVIGIVAGEGHVAWRYPVVNQYKNNASMAIWGKDNLLWVASQMEAGTRALRLTQTGGKTSVTQAWFNPKIKIHYWNALHLEDHIYAAIGDSVTYLAGIRFADGEIQWRQRGLDTGSALFADGKMIFLGGDGKLSLLKVSTQKAEILAEAKILEPVSRTVPTLVDRILYARDQKTILALDLGAP